MSAGAAGRRSSVGIPERRDIGDPYTVYTEIVNTGKNVGGTKKKIKWIFGFSELNDEFEVILVHSLVSGKKSITENGEEIVSTSNMLSTDFSHGWSSSRTNRFYRVELSLSVGSEYAYVFSVDGLPFSQMPDKSMVRVRSLAKAENNSRYGSSDFQSSSTSSAPSTSTAVRRASLGAASGTSNNSSSNRLSAPRGTFQSPSNGKSIGGDGAFDPFGPSGDSAPFDPFAGGPSGMNASPGAVAASSQAVSTSASKRTSSVAKPSPRASGHAASAFDPFDGTPGQISAGEASASHSQAALSFDAFSNAPGQSTDPFGSPPPAASTATRTADFDPFGSTPSPPNKSAAISLPPPKAPAVSAAASLFQSFDEPVSSSQDVFGTATQTATTKPPARRSSAQEISMDFAGLSFGAPPSMPPMQVSPPPPAAAMAAPTVASPEAPAIEADKPANDPWAHGRLVDLDLTGKSLAAKRNPSASAGPSLNSMLGVSTSQPASRRSSVQGGAQLTPTDLLNAMNDPFGAPPLLSASQSGPGPAGFGAGGVGGGGMASAPNRPAMSPAFTISSMGGPAPNQPMMTPGFGAPPRGPAMMAGPSLGGPMSMAAGGGGGGMAGSGPGMMGGPPPQHRASIGGGGPMSGGPMSGGVPTMGNRPGYATGLPLPMTSQAPKSSLDSLDWKA